LNIKKIVIGLRHDVDTSFGILKGIPKTIEIERTYGVKSTFFIRVKALEKSGLEGVKILKDIEEEGWEIGLHLDNIWNIKKMPSPLEELKELQSYGFKIYGVTPHGGIFHPKRNIVWYVLDSLGLKYIQGYGECPINIKSIVIPSHITLDWFIKRYGYKDGYNRFIRKLYENLSKWNIGIVMTHPEYMILSPGLINYIGARSKGYKARLLKFLNKLTIPLSTLFRYRVLDDIYRHFLEEHSMYKFMTLYEISELVNNL